MPGQDFALCPEVQQSHEQLPQPSLLRGLTETFPGGPVSTYYSLYNFTQLCNAVKKWERYKNKRGFLGGQAQTVLLLRSLQAQEGREGEILA